MPREKKRKSAKLAEKHNNLQQVANCKPSEALNRHSKEMLLELKGGGLVQSVLIEIYNMLLEYDMFEEGTHLGHFIIK